MTTTTDPYSEFLAKVLAHVPEEKRGEIEATLNDDKVSSEVKGLVMTRSDYSRSKDALSKQEKELADQKAQLTQWYLDNSKVVQDASTERDAALARVKEFEAKHGVLSDDDKKALNKGIDPDAILAKMKEELQNRDMAGFKVMSIITKLGRQHDKTFNEELDIDELAKFSSEKGLSLEMGYKEWVAPRVKDKEIEAHKAEITRAVEDAVKQERSKHGLPVAPSDRSATIFGHKAENIVTNEFERAAKFRDSFVTGQAQRT